MKNKYVRIAVIFFSLILLVCPILNLGASAYNSPLTGIGINFVNLNNLPFGSIGGFDFSLQSRENMQIGTVYFTIPSGVAIVYTDNGNKYIDVVGEVLSLSTNDIDDGVYQFIGMYNIDSGLALSPQDAEYYSTGYATNDGIINNILVYNGGGSINQNYDLVDLSPIEISVNVILYNLDIPYGNTGGSGGGTSTECPTLQQQIQGYNGTWAEFQGMMTTNSTLYEDFLEQKRIAYNDGIDMGQQDIINSINNDNDFLSLMDTFLNYGMNNTRNVIEDQIDLVYQNGIDRGIEEGYSSAYDDGYEEGIIVGGEIGYNRGYQSGYNKGVSDEFVGGFFTNMLNAPINILNGIVIYQISDGGTPLDKTDDVNITVWGVLVVAVIISLFLILLKIFAGG